MSARGVVLALFLAAVVGLPAIATGQQTAASCPPATGEPYLLCQVDRGPRPDPHNAAPRFPDMLLQASFGGTARVRYVVDLAGHVKPGLQVVSSKHDLFVQSIKNAYMKWTFEPASRSGRAVAVWYEEVFEFSPPPDADKPASPAVVMAGDTAGGIPLTVIGVRDRDSVAASRFSEAELLEVQRTVLLSLVPAPVADSSGRPRVVLCLTTLRGGRAEPADSMLLSALSAPGRRAVVPRDCPRTYASMIYDPRKQPPPGWIDPYAMVVTRVVPWNAETILIEVDVSQGMSTSFYQCTATRESVPWRVTCRHSRSALH